MMRSFLVMGLAVALVGSAAGQEKTLYKGQDAAYWGKRLLDADKETSRTGAIALEKIGRESTPFVVDGCKSSITHVRGHALGILISAGWPKGEKKVFVPVVIAALKDEEPGIRGSAALVVANLQFQECVEPLQQAAAAENDQATKKRMNDVLGQLAKDKGK